MLKQHSLQNKEYYILYIEDNPGDVQLLREALEMRGIPINLHNVIDGHSAIDIVLKNNLVKPDLIIIDINIPKIDGITILGLIKQSDRYKNIPTIILSSSNNETDINNCYKLGANSYLIKPFDWDQYENIAESITDMFLTNPEEY